MIKPGEATGDSAEYESIMRDLNREGAPLSVIADALRHILKRIGPPDDESSLAGDAERFERDFGLTE